MEVIFSPDAKDDLQYWKNINNTKIQNRITKLIKAIELNPFSGIGKPEPLKYELSGFWSRRINKEHRIIYEVRDNEIHIVSLRDHYKKGK